MHFQVSGLFVRAYVYISGFVSSALAKSYQPFEMLKNCHSPFMSDVL